MKPITRIVWLFSALILTLSACAQPTPSGPSELRVLTHDSFAASEEVIRAFEQENNVKLTFLPSGDTGSALNQAILTKNAPLADVFYGVDNTFLSRALSEDIFEPYNSPLLAEIDDAFKLDPQNRALPVDYGDVCINYDKAYFAEKDLPLPQSLADLTRPEYKGLLVVENPATSSPGLAFLMATIAAFGEEGYLDFWRQLKDNGVVVVNDWETAYYTNFSASSGRGPQPMVVSYGSSPPAEVIFAEQPLEDAPTASLVGDGMCFRQIEFVGILKGTKQRALAEKFVDFMLDVRFQEDLPLQMFVFPVNRKAQLPQEFVRYAQIPAKPATLDPALIAEKREAWIEAWTQAVLR
ncbi:thiamine ABC transporter substrate-binding protein [Bellilinea sp.]|jgi:thiamine transport system substrate-binding protein|uniref:thiamine ABC transporter substrate-binding protein n=1 Tax=Bellilinea sp. TaxID=2838785 RepID=UPI002ADDCDF7|nr:thiamine ABC transporter substrate-binding protein [Bellilinea sp.]